MPWLHVAVVVRSGAGGRFRTPRSKRRRSLSAKDCSTPCMMPRGPSEQRWPSREGSVGKVSSLVGDIKTRGSVNAISKKKSRTGPAQCSPILRPVRIVETLAALRPQNGERSSDRNEILHNTLCHSIDKNSDPARRIRQVFFFTPKI